MSASVAAQRRQLPARSALIVIFGVVVPLALLPILASLRGAWSGPEIMPIQASVLLSAFGGGIGLLLLKAAVVFELVRRRRSWDAVFLVTAVAVAHLSNRLLKDVFDAARPATVDGAGGRLVGIPEIVVLAIVAGVVALGYFTRWRERALLLAGILVGLLALETAVDLLVPLVRGFDSFPSGHGVSSMAFALAVGVIAWDTRWRAVVVVMALFVLGVGASRVYLGVHYPADVIGGWCVAVASVSASWLIVRSVRARLAEPAPPVTAARP